MIIEATHWIWLGGVLVIAELLLPGLVVVFVGLGALTVALGMHLMYIESIPQQLITWFASSTLYLFSLRQLVVRYYPSDTVKQNIDEDKEVIGKMVKVTEKITPESEGRIAHGDITWQAKIEGDESAGEGDEVEVIRRENITWLVKKVSKKEST